MWIAAYAVGSEVILMAVYALLVWKVQRDYNTRGTLSPLATVGVWALYLLHSGLTGFAAWRSLWTLPFDQIVAGAIGGVFLIVGVGLTAAGIVAFRSFQRMSGLEANKLVTAGVYRYSRNPQNVGWGLVLLGAALMGRSALALMLAALFWLMLHVYLVEVEELYLDELFGEAYRKYRATIARYLGPPKSRHH